MTPLPLFADNGFVEIAQMLALALGTLCFGLAAAVARTPGGPMLMLSATAMGVATLHEFDLDSGSAVLAYSVPSLPQQLAALGLIGTALLALRRPMINPRRHLAAVAPLAPVLLSAAGLVLIGNSLNRVDLAHPAGLAMEQSFKLLGYGLAATVGLRTAVRVVRRPGRPVWRAITAGPCLLLTSRTPGSGFR